MKPTLSVVYRSSAVRGLVFFLIWITLTQSLTAYANGRIGETIKKTAEPYEISFGTIPERLVAGAVHVVITLKDIETGNPVLDADITVVALGPKEGLDTIGPLTALNNIDSPIFYETNVYLSQEGTWEFTVSVNSQLGEASTQFLVQVLPKNIFGDIFTWVTVTMFFALLMLGILPLVKQKFKKEEDK